MKNKPVVFISSTIYDFGDLRSAMKYWLNEMGYDAQLSEYNDFIKDSTQNSYDACIGAIEQCDYFVLLIGSRKGGMYNDEDISITRKEYRTAYNLAKDGKIKKIIVLIRQNVWDVKEDRKSLYKVIKDFKIYENDKQIENSQIEKYNSNILMDAEHIISFIDEVTRNEEAKGKQKPIMNWVHTFSTFEDVVNVLKVELRIHSNMAVKMAEQNVKSELVYNLQNILSTNDEQVIGYHFCFKRIRLRLESIVTANLNGEYKSYNIMLSSEDVNSISVFLLFFRYGIKDMETSIFENIISSGVFLSYCSEKETFIQDDFCKALNQMVREINRLKQFESEFSIEKQASMIDIAKQARNNPNKMWNFDLLDIGMLNSIYERITNIVNLSSFMIQFINTHDKNLKYPVILNGFISERPSEEAILKIYE